MTWSALGRPAAQMEEQKREPVQGALAGMVKTLQFISTQAASCRIGVGVL